MKMTIYGVMDWYWESCNIRYITNMQPVKFFVKVKLIIQNKNE